MLIHLKGTKVATYSVVLVKSHDVNKVWLSILDLIEDLKNSFSQVVFMSSHYWENFVKLNVTIYVTKCGNKWKVTMVKKIYKLKNCSLTPILSPMLIKWLIRSR